MADLQQRSAAWHVARRGKLTASNLGACLGLVSYTSRLEAFRRALGIDKFTGNDATQWGTNNEMNGIIDYQRLTGNAVQSTGLHVHKNYHWLAGSPDGFVGEEGMIEVKCPFYRRKDGSRLHKTIPLHYYTQINALLEITGRQWCDYICWTPEGMVVYRVQRDPAIFDYLLTHYSHFYAAMEMGLDKPPPFSSDDKQQVALQVAKALELGTDYTFWERADPLFPPPECSESDDDEPLSKRFKSKQEGVNGSSGE